MEYAWVILCAINVPVTSIGLWLVKTTSMNPDSRRRKKVVGMILVMIGAVIMFYTTKYPKTFTDGLIWSTLTISALFLGASGWIGAGLRMRSIRR